MEKKLFETVFINTRFKRHHFEALADREGFLVAGIDEVGRGPGAGPVLAAAVVLHPGKRHPLLKDSKILTADQRAKAYTWLLQNSWHGWASISAHCIDHNGIAEATKIAMERAFHNLCQVLTTVPTAVLVDAVPLSLPLRRDKNSPPDPFLSLCSKQLRSNLTEDQAESVLRNPRDKVIAFYYGEQQSRTIAAASIIAKVIRDQIMTTLAPLFPIYGFGDHKGYTTPAHRYAIDTYGISVLHRRVWKSNQMATPSSATQDVPEASMPIFHEIPKDSKENY